MSLLQMAVKHLFPRLLEFLGVVRRHYVLCKGGFKKRYFLKKIVTRFFEFFGVVPRHCVLCKGD
jgi:hypothetical protein